MNDPAVTRDRVAGLSFAMRILARRFSDDVTILLNEAEYEPKAQTISKLAEQCGHFAEQVTRFTKYVDNAMKRSAPAAD